MWSDGLSAGSSFSLDSTSSVAVVVRLTAWLRVLVCCWHRSSSSRNGRGVAWLQ